MVKKFYPVVTLAIVALIAACFNGLSEAQEHNNSGVEHSDNGLMEKAISEYDQAIRLDSDLAEAYLNRANAYVELGLHERANQDYTEVIRLDPRDIYV